ncbi:HAD superfamily hydrolase [Halalkaliarchaeum sp. AArc-CO]|uniref:HAD family hydrolase n=1 Tax=Halalkaliarchaeum sp. AArc-GB TaxID=3074078 RepID=UPI00217CF4F8|nr:MULTISPECIES: HAD family hydrolase [unclassified Halalkaliarchaeum]MDR5674049.1 HAD family hydrolase [Halalkaliarchaeum sp. AArc-GB]UWG50779.1 HAD superfamily hydrolase [Halalkaliarchaeum sp. AArc-CO]
MSDDRSIAITFDLFGTLVSASRPDDPAEALAEELRTRDVSVPENWEELYATPQVDIEPGRELSLPDHVRAALEESGVDTDSPGQSRRPDGPGSGEADVVTEAVRAAFDRRVNRRDGAGTAIEAASRRGRVGLLSNCSVPGLVDRTLERVALDGRFDAVLASVDVGYRKPDRRAFQAAADRLGVDVTDLVHVGDNPETDGGIEDVGGIAILLENVSLSAVPDRLSEVRIQ